MNRSSRQMRPLRQRSARGGALMALALLTAIPVWSAGDAQAASPEVLPHKIRFLDQMIERAAPVGGTALDEARRLRSQADTAMKAGQTEEADQRLTSALKLLATQSLSSGPSAAAQEAEARRHYTELNEGIAVNREALTEAVRLKGTTLAAVVDLAKVDALVVQARQMAKAGNLQKALEPLEAANRTLEAAVVQLRSKDTVTYSREFKTPHDELRFEASRFEANHQLLARAREATLSARQRAILAALDAEVRALSDRADALSKAGNIQGAIRSIEQANTKILGVVMEVAQD